MSVLIKYNNNILTVGGNALSSPVVLPANPVATVLYLIPEN